MRQLCEDLSEWVRKYRLGITLFILIQILLTVREGALVEKNFNLNDLLNEKHDANVHVSIGTPISVTKDAEFSPVDNEVNNVDTNTTEEVTENQPKNLNIVNAQLSENHEFMAHRNTHYDFTSWFVNSTKKTGKKARLKVDADEDGPIIDFLVAGGPKCGSTTMIANLARIAPVPVADSCAPIHQLVYYSYKLWPDKYPPNEDGGDGMKIYRGVKCPQYVEQLKQVSRRLPKTKLIVGIRHPVLWFQSFWNMQATNDWKRYQKESPYNRTKSCKEVPQKSCKAGCPGQLYCVHRSRFHLKLAQMGKTPLSDDERKLLAPNDYDGGDKVKNQEIRNSVFLYETSDMKEDDVWEELGRYLDYPGGAIPHDRRQSARGNLKNAEEHDLNTIDICDAEYDKLRKQMMPYAYEMSKWICDYFVPLAEDETRDDVWVANPDRFCSIVRDYANDPCDRLVRMENGEYELKDGI